MSTEPLPGLGPIRLFGEIQDNTVRLLEQLSDHMMFNGDFSDDERDLVVESLRSARGGTIPRATAPRLRKYIQVMRANSA